MAESKCLLKNMLPAVLSVGNEEQSMFYSPRVFTEHYNIVYSLLISNLVKAYPSNPMVIDQLEPFVEIKLIPVVNGYVDLPEDYRDILGSPYIFKNPKSNGECGNEDIEPLTAQSFKIQNLKGGCQMRPVIIYPESEFIYRTDAEYDYPTWDAPIGFFSGKRQIKVCPYDISKVAVMYVRNEKKCNYGYIMQPDDTYLYDPATSEESELGSNCYEPVFNALCALYSVYSKDQEMSNWTQVLHERGIL